MLSVIKVPRDLRSTRGKSNHLPSAVGDFVAFQPFGQAFCVLGTCLRQAGSAAGNFILCDSYLPGKAGKGKQVVLFMLKVSGRLQAMFQVLCF